MLARHELGEVSKLLLAAADYMEKHGWCAGIRKDATDQVCALGAFDQACALGAFEMDIDYYHAVCRLAEHVKIPEGHHVYTKTHPYSAEAIVADWSNASDGPTVVAKMREVAYDPQYALIQYALILT